MGLSISRSIIEAHGGRMWASANVSRGAIFEFTLPAHRDLVMALVVEATARNHHLARFAKAPARQRFCPPY
jgi:hypothetical protein